MLEIKNCCKSYDKTEAIKNINIKIEDGTIHGLIGENGSGKTTLIKCVVGLYAPNEGSISWDGIRVYENPEIKQCIGYVSDSNRYFGNYRVKEMIKLFKEMYPTFSEERFKELNKSFKVEERKRMNQLSKGQQMRVAFMLNMAFYPKLLVLDEPTDGLDAIAKKELLEIIVDEVEKNQMTVLISSHQLSELDKICDGITMIKDGEIIMQNELASLKENVSKLNVVFETGIFDALESVTGILHYENVGSIYTIIINEYGEKQENELRKMGAKLIEPVEIGLEELFIYASMSK